MGAWAAGPLENDTALDFMFALEKRPVVDVIDIGLTSDNNDEVRAAAWLLKALYRVYPIMRRDATTKTAIERLNRILDQGEWISTWSNPDQVVQMIREEISYFEQVSS
jgi:hypothetical protein